MIFFQAPLWLLLLSLIPLIRWLHRFRLVSSILPSVTTFLWAGLRRQINQGGDPEKPAARWILRALISATMILALAQPYQQNFMEIAFDVWVDDSLSMFTREQNQFRIQAGLKQLKSYLGEHNSTEIRIHSLANPTSRFSLNPTDSDDWTPRLDEWFSQPRSEPIPPPAASMAKNRYHILITDGADANLNRWAKLAPLGHIIRVGETAENTTVSALSLRKSLIHPQQVTGIVRIDNPGDQLQRVQLVVEQQQGIIKNLPLDIPAAANSITSFSIAAAESGYVEARLENKNDTLSFDNSLKLDQSNLQASLAYTIEGQCSPQVMAVLNSHPVFIRSQESAELLIDCSDQVQSSSLPTLKLHRPVAVRRTTQSAHWHGEFSLDYAPIAAGLAYDNAAPELSFGKIPILSANGRQLILQQTGMKQVIDCYLDTGDTIFSQQASFPLLILALISRLTERDLGTPPSTIDRELQASRIKPLAYSSSPELLPIGEPTRQFFVTQLLLIALVLLLVDAALSLFAVSSKPAR